MSDHGVTLISFGYLHAAAPSACLTVDVRAHFRDPHVDPALRYLTAYDPAVRDAVYATAGIASLCAALVDAISAYRSGPSGGPVAVAIGCAGGRHRAPSIAMAVASHLRDLGLTATEWHRDIERPVIGRAA
jgi:UPF0042 nucleotide-binding protein